MTTDILPVLSTDTSVVSTPSTDSTSSTEFTPFPTPPLVYNSSEEEVKAVDALQLHYQFLQAAQYWKEVHSIDTFCKMALMTTRLQKERRDLFLLPKEAPQSSKKRDVVYPLAD